MAVYRTLTRGRRVVAAAAGVLVAVASAASPAVAQTAGTAPQFASGAVTSVHGDAVQVTNQTQNSESTVVLSPTTQVTKRVTASNSAITVGACVRVTGTGSATKGITARSVVLERGHLERMQRCAGRRGSWRERRRRVPLRQRATPPELRQRQRQRVREPGRRPDRELRARLRTGGLGEGRQDRRQVDDLPATLHDEHDERQEEEHVEGHEDRHAHDEDEQRDGDASERGRDQRDRRGTTADVAVGSCVTATGTNSAGSVTANRVVVSQPVSGSCTAGFGFGGGPRPGAGGGNGTNGSV